MRKHLTLALATSVLVGLGGCDEPAPDARTVTAPETAAASARSSGPNVVNVLSEGLNFELSRDQIASGWTTFRYKNRSRAAHFFLIEKLPLFDKDGDGTPEQMRKEDLLEDLSRPFQNLMDAQIGRPASFPDAQFGAWGTQYLGGSGMTSAGQTADVTVWLEPGLYAIECYVKSPDGRFHVVDGMVEEIQVHEGPGNQAGPPPNPTLRLNVSAAGGIQVQGSIERPGTHTVEVYFEDQAFYGNFVQHDVNLVRVDQDTDLAQVASWMDWRLIPGDPYYGSLGGLISPAPATFLGGTQEQPAGTTTYFSVHLERGDYAWIAEIPAAELLSSGGPDWIVPFSVR